MDQMGAEGFRRQFRRLLVTRDWSVRRLAAHTGYSHQWLSEILAGTSGKHPSPELIQDLDDALNGEGSLVAAALGGEDVDRRDLLRNAGVLGMLAPLTQVELVRQGLDSVLGTPTVDQWHEIVAEYARTFYLTEPGELIHDLLADILVLQHQLATAHGRAQRALSAQAGALAAIAAMTWASQGERRQARRWWQTARHAADASGDDEARVWVRAWEVANGLYERRPIPHILDLAGEARTIAADRVDAGAAGLYAGLAQTLAVAGNHTDALAALHTVDDLTERMPGGPAAEADSMLGWPLVRLRHTESYVYTAIGDTNAAYSAQDAALGLYHHDLQRERAAMLLHRARCMVLDGDISGGVGFAHQVLDELPPEHHSDLVYAVARTVTTTVTAGPHTAAARELRDRLTVPSSRT